MAHIYIVNATLDLPQSSSPAQRGPIISTRTVAWLLGGFVTAFFALVSMYANPDALALRRLETMRTSGIAYDSRSLTPRPYEIVGTSDYAVDGLELDPETGLLRELKARYLHISMVFNARSLGGHSNIFQTASYNAGVRLEISDHVLVLILASHSASGFDVIFVSNDLLSGVDHTIDLLIDRHDRVVLKFDGKTVTDALVPQLDYQISDVVVGSGFSKLRPFDGRINNASLEYAIYRTNPNADALRLDLTAFLLMIMVVCAYYLVGPERRFELRWPWLSAPSWRWQSPSALNRPLSNAPDESVRRYVWPLPGDAFAEVVFERRQLTSRALEHLAKELDLSAGHRPRPAATSIYTIVENTWRLPNDVVATIRTSSSERAALRRLAAHVRELAGCVLENG